MGTGTAYTFSYSFRQGIERTLEVGRVGFEITSSTFQMILIVRVDAYLQSATEVVDENLRN